MRTVEDVMEQAGRVFDAGLAATEALFGLRGSDRRDTGSEQR